MKMLNYCLACVALAWGSLSAASATDSASLLDKAISGEHRDAANVVRDQFRHPKQTLLFFGIEPTMSVVEIWPSKGWYSEIIAPVVNEHGQYYAAGFGVTAQRTPQWRKDMQQQFDQKLAAYPQIYGNTIVTELSIPERTEMAPAASADMVLTFRNVHNWMKGDYAQEMFQAINVALKPGGILGVVEHRAKEGTSVDDMIRTGYVSESHIIQLAKNAGFILVDSSEVNANAKDSTDHPKGVWTLPPSLRLGDEKREHYLSIGESDRMTLKFIKAK